ncbi:MAG: hypothetical protein HY753_06910 [Nitrospirae bacterium]|nr:hypothetical protein [Nitrospirota bacterium]
MNIYILTILSTLLLVLGVISCDGRDFVYVDDSTFNKQVLNLKNGYVEIVYNVDPTKERGVKVNGTPWPVLREKKFNKRNQLSDELCKLIYDVIKRGQRYSGKGWHPTYEVYIKHPIKRFIIFNSKMYFVPIFDFKNAHIFIDGRNFSLTEEENHRGKELLEQLLNIDV